MSAEDQLADLERRVLATQQIANYLAQVDALRALLTAADPSLVQRVLELVPPAVEGVALVAIAEAYAAGRSDALENLEDRNAVERRTRGSLPSPASRSIVLGLDAAGEQAAMQSRLLAMQGADPEAILAPILAHANSIQGRVTAGVNYAGNDGSTKVADVARVPTVWIAERNACVHCLAYSGQVAEPGKDFPGGLTYGKKSYHPDPLPHPPLHPHCRCTVEPLNSPEFAAALKREANRSVLRGYSLSSESMGVRIDAAQRLLDSGVVAPKSVIAYAKAAIKRGKFDSRGRE